MAYKCGTTAWGSTGVKTFTTTFLPIRMNVFVNGIAGSNDGVQGFSNGSADGTRQFCATQFSDGTVIFREDFSDRVISVWEDVGGVATEVLSGTFNSFNATSVKFNCTIADANYNIRVEAQS